MRDARVAEIFYAIKSVVPHHSLRNYDGLSDSFVKMFPDSNIAKEFSMGQTKLCYIICYGPAPYFKSKIMQSFSSSSCIKRNFAVLFDEAFNSVILNNWMYIFHILTTKKMLFVKIIMIHSFWAMPLRKTNWRTLKPSSKISIMIPI